MFFKNALTQANQNPSIMESSNLKLLDGKGEIYNMSQTPKKETIATQAIYTIGEKSQSQKSSFSPVEGAQSPLLLSNEDLNKIASYINNSIKKELKKLSSLSNDNDVKPTSGPKI